MKDDQALLNEIYSEKILSNWVTSHTIFSSRSKINLVVEQFFDAAVKRLGKDTLRVLDVGCYYGGAMFHFLHKYRAKNMLFHGIDIDPIKIAYAKDLQKHMKNKTTQKHIGFSVLNIEQEKPKETYDIIICIETIEHVHDVKTTLQNMYAALNPNGLLVISTPNKNNQFKYLIPFRKKVKSSIEDPDHVKGGHAIAEELFGIKPKYIDGDYHWSVMSLAEIKHILKTTGFHLEKIRRGPLVYGGTFFDKKPLLTAALNLFDELLNFFHIGKQFTYDFILLARKPKL